MRSVVAVLPLLALVSACAVEQPTNVEVDAPPGADDAAAIVVQEWSESLGVDLDVADLPPVRWFEGACLDYPGEDECLAGALKWTPLATEIHLAIRPLLHDSSLAHEVLHWALEETAGDYDVAHENVAWAGLDDVADTLASAGM
jgi:hypothetical protein